MKSQLGWNNFTMKTRDGKQHGKPSSWKLAMMVHNTTHHLFRLAQAKVI